MFTNNAYCKFGHIKSLEVYDGFVIRCGVSTCVRLSCAKMPKPC